MPRTQSHGEATRKRILQASIILLARKGYSCATFEEIARAGRVSKGAVQYHFPKLSKLFIEIHDLCLGAAFERWHSWIMETPGTARDRLSIASRNYLNWSGSDDHLAMIEIQMAARGNRELAKPLAQARRQHLTKHEQNAQIQAKAIAAATNSTVDKSFSRYLARVEYAARSKALDRLLIAVITQSDAVLHHKILDGLLDGVEEPPMRLDGKNGKRSAASP